MLIQINLLTLIEFKYFQITAHKSSKTLWLQESGCREQQQHPPLGDHCRRGLESLHNQSLG